MCSVVVYWPQTERTQAEQYEWYGTLLDKIRDYYGSGWVSPGLTRIFCFCFENHPKIALNQY